MARGRSSSTILIIHTVQTEENRENHVQEASSKSDVRVHSGFLLDPSNIVITTFSLHSYCSSGTRLILNSQEGQEFYRRRRHVLMDYTVIYGLLNHVTSILD